MPAPCIDLVHLKTSKQYNGANLINRYWFEWKNRRDLSNLVIRLELQNDNGDVITNASVRLPKVKVTGYVPASGSSPQQPIYDSSVWIQLDDLVRDELPTQFCFYTVSGFKKSSVALGKMNGKYEDLSMHL